MLKKVTQSLTGRTAVFELLPMYCSEVHDIVENLSLDELLFNGFYPELVSIYLIRR